MFIWWSGRHKDLPENRYITVENSNDSPVIDNGISDQSATEDIAFNFVVPANTFSDPDVGDTLSLSATLAADSPLPLWLDFHAATRTFDGTPTNDDVGILSVKVTATDGDSASVSDIFDIDIGNVNDPPVVELVDVLYGQAQRQVMQVRIRCEGSQ